MVVWAERVLEDGGRGGRLAGAARRFRRCVVGCDGGRAEGVLGWDPALAGADAAALLEGLRAAGVLQVD